METIYFGDDCVTDPAEEFDLIGTESQGQCFNDPFTEDQNYYDYEITCGLKAGEDICCDPEELEELTCFEGCECCADGRIVGSIGDGRTFPCADNDSVNKEDNPEFFGEYCEEDSDDDSGDGGRKRRRRRRRRRRRGQRPRGKRANAAVGDLVVDGGNNDDGMLKHLESGQYNLLGLKVSLLDCILIGSNVIVAVILLCVVYVACIKDKRKGNYVRANDEEEIEDQVGESKPFKY